MSHYGPHLGRAPAFRPGAAPLPQQQGAIGRATCPAPAVRAVPSAQVRSGSRVLQAGDMLAVAHVLHGLDTEKWTSEQFLCAVVCALTSQVDGAWTALDGQMSCKRSCSLFRPCCCKH